MFGGEVLPAGGAGERVPGRAHHLGPPALAGGGGRGPLRRGGLGGAPGLGVGVGVAAAVVVGAQRERVRRRRVAKKRGGEEGEG